AASEIQSHCTVRRKACRKQRGDDGADKIFSTRRRAVAVEIDVVRFKKAITAAGGILIAARLAPFPRRSYAYPISPSSIASSNFSRRTFSRRTSFQTGNHWPFVTFKAVATR